MNDINEQRIENYRQELELELEKVSSELKDISDLAKKMLVLIEAYNKNVSK